MRLLLDQMIDRAVAGILRRDGLDVVCTSEVGLATADDHEILKYCVKNRRILVTLDEHFGDWTAIKLNKHPGVIRLKVDPATTGNIVEYAASFFKRNVGRAFDNLLVIVKPHGVRWVSTY